MWYCSYGPYHPSFLLILPYGPFNLPLHTTHHSMTLRGPWPHLLPRANRLARPTLRLIAVTRLSPTSSIAPCPPPVRRCERVSATEPCGTTSPPTQARLQPRGEGGGAVQPHSAPKPLGNTFTLVAPVHQHPSVLHCPFLRRPPLPIPSSFLSFSKIPQPTITVPSLIANPK